MNMKATLPMVLVSLLLFSSLVSSIQLGMVHAFTSFHGIINSDATWTTANSPYILNGPVAVNIGVTLTIEAGVTVNLNGYYIQVNGTLVARGSNTDKINFSGGSIVFNTVGNSWNEQTGSGSIIENSVLSATSISIGNNVAPKITHSSFEGIYINGDSTISYNTIHSITIAIGSPSIFSNYISGDFTVEGGAPTINNNTVDTRLVVDGGFPLISNNKIFDGIHADSRGGQVTIYSNEMSSKNGFRVIYVQGIHAEISNNNITGNGNTGINVAGSLSSASISNNVISRCRTGIDISVGGITTIVRNLVFSNDVGINFGISYGGDGNVTVQDNTLRDNSVGIQCNPSPLLIITNNNIQSSSQYNFRLQSPNNITAANNWWGTTDSSAISQTIYDNKNDFNLGSVNFTPFLTAPNPEAQPIPNSNPTSMPTLSPLISPTPTSSLVISTPTATVMPSQSPHQSSSPSQNPITSPAAPQPQFNEIAIALIVVAVVMIAAVIVLMARLFRKKR